MKNQTARLIIDTEEKAKLVALAMIGTSLLCDGRPLVGAGCFALMLPWGILARVAGWLVHPVIVWRKSKPKRKEAVEELVA